MKSAFGLFLKGTVGAGLGAAFYVLAIMIISGHLPPTNIIAVNMTFAALWFGGTYGLLFALTHRRLEPTFASCLVMGIVATCIAGACFLTLIGWDMFLLALATSPILAIGALLLQSFLMGLGAWCMVAVTQK